MGAVELVYEVFGRVPRPVRVEGCPHCVAPDEDRKLLDRPLRAIEAKALARYAAKALNTWGGVAEFRYFLPRLLEFAAVDAFDYPDPALVFGKLSEAGWTEWDEDERAAIRAFMSEWWDGTLERFPSWPDVGTVLSSLGGAEVELGPFLKRWERLASVAAIRHMHEFVLYAVTWRAEPRLVFWPPESTPHRDAVEWLTGGAALAAVESAFEGESREDVLELLVEIHAVLEAAQDFTFDDW